MKKVIAKILNKMAVLTAFSAVFITAKDFPCLLFVGEPEIPESLMEQKTIKIKEYHESSNM